MKAITVKYLCPTNNRGARVKATDGDNSITIPYCSALSDAENHRRAVRELCAKLLWEGTLICGHTKTGTVWVWDCPSDKMRVDYNLY